MPSLPPAPWAPDWDRERLAWLGPTRGPFFCGQDLDAARLVLAGDSRLGAGLDPRELDDAGLGPVARVWGPGALAYELVPAAGTLGARRLVLALSALALCKKQAVAAHVILREPLPRWDPGRVDAGLLAWRTGWRHELQALGFSAAQIGSELDPLAGALRRLQLADRLHPAAIDERLGAAADRARRALVRPIEPADWDTAFLPAASLAATLDYYAALLPRTPPEHLTANLESTRRELAALVAQGWEVVCLRLPIDARLAALEDAVLAPERLAGLCAGLGLPLLDQRSAAYETLDGSHLAAHEVARFSSDLARELRRGQAW